ncbi:MAG: SUMF1/EgtB/PvdO family nonheme iron enzyme [SAR324 cluster bacterium]|nr:SUMF1/EgtB/PvdO family nonheme iron enzyme [SAR324 cluster bacterium]
MAIKNGLKNRCLKFSYYFFTLLCASILLIGELQAFDSIKLAQQVAGSLNQISSKKYSTVAFSRIQGALNQETVNELIDYTENEIVQGRRFRLIDRSKLQLILREQKFNLNGMVSQDTYKALGKLLGIDLFIYGRYYGDTIVYKAIDVESSAIVWANTFQLTDLSIESRTLNNLTEKVTESLRDSLDRLQGTKIKQISFWNLKSEFEPNRVIDYLSVAISKEGNFQVVDRENLELILEEQKLNMEDYIDEKKAKQMGELYGVDAFIYGRISSKPSGYIASLKMMNIYTGVIEWAKTIRFSDEKSDSRTQRTPNIKNNENMIHIQAGAFVMGSDNGPKISGPTFRVSLKDFYLDRTEVSNREYEQFVKKFKHRAPPSWPGGKIPAGQEDLPVVQVNWNDARRYCSTLGKRLPKEVEWEKAFRGENGNTYPWSGNQIYPSYAKTVESGVLAPDPVGSTNKDVSVYGVQNLAGNVREWVESFLIPYPGTKLRYTKRGERVIRGGSWAKTKEHSVGWFRDSSNPSYGWEDVGFRCAKSAN